MKSRSRRTYRMVTMVQPELIEAFHTRGYKPSLVAYYLLRDFALKNDLITRENLRDITKRSDKENEDE